MSHLDAAVQLEHLFSFRFTAKADAGSDCEGENEQRVNAEYV